MVPREMCPRSNLAPLVRGCGPWYPVDWLRSWYGRVSRVPTYQTGHRAKLESVRAEITWYSKTVLLSGRDRSQNLCLLRQSSFEHETRLTKAWRPPFLASASFWRALVMMRGKEMCQIPGPVCN